MIRRNTDPMKGPADGVAADLNCVVTQYDKAKEKGSTKKGIERTVMGQATMPCTVFCSYSDGTLGVSIRGIDLQIDLLVEELMAVMQAGAEANQELTAPLREEYTDADLEGKWRELQSVQLVEADSPSGMITAKAWWVFPQGIDRDDLCAWFGERHSRGRGYFIELIGGGRN